MAKLEAKAKLSLKELATLRQKCIGYAAKHHRKKQASLTEDQKKALNRKLSADQVERVSKMSKEKQLEYKNNRRFHYLKAQVKKRSTIAGRAEVRAKHTERNKKRQAKMTEEEYAAFRAKENARHRDYKARKRAEKKAEGMLAESMLSIGGCAER